MRQGWREGMEREAGREGMRVAYDRTEIGYTYLQTYMHINV